MDSFSLKFYTKLRKYQSTTDSEEFSSKLLDLFSNIDHSKCLILPDAKKWLLYLGKITGQINNLENMENSDCCKKYIEQQFEVHRNEGISEDTLNQQNKTSFDENFIYCSNPYHYSKAWSPEMNKVKFSKKVADSDLHKRENDSELINFDDCSSNHRTIQKTTPSQNNNLPVISYWSYKTRYFEKSDQLPKEILNYICFSVMNNVDNQNLNHLRVYNRLPNDKNIFLTSDYLRRKFHNNLPSVFRLPPGCYIDLGPLLNTDKNNNHNSSVWISVGKGFGPGYSRSEIIHCPLWMEIYMK